ncbi:MAG TPA: hypothetical protein VFX59_00850 [Polyangiales bacterium]|nr:hypothetical protein [Polyangiales bacterium]
MKLSLLALLLVACTRTTELVPPRVDAQTPDAQALPSEAGVLALCGNAPCACANGLDDDGDGLSDGFDPECSAPFDNHEDSFATGVHGEGQDTKCQDCFFDDDSGGCKRARSCALDGTAASGTGACRSCELAPTCTESCLPRVPNGCDCYGCCEIWRDGALLANVLLSASCSLATLDDVAKCVRCTPATDCSNPCGSCELCTGRTLRDLPASCGNTASCEGATACAGETDCPSGYYCQQGCCTPTSY